MKLDYESMIRIQNSNKSLATDSRGKIYLSKQCNQLNNPRLRVEINNGSMILNSYVKLITLLILKLVTISIFATILTPNLHAGTWIRIEFNKDQHNITNVIKETDFSGTPRTILINAGSALSYPKFNGKIDQGGRTGEGNIGKYANHQVKYTVKINDDPVEDYTGFIDNGTYTTPYGTWYVSDGDYCNLHAINSVEYTYDYCGTFSFTPNSDAINKIGYDKIELGVVYKNENDLSDVKVKIKRDHFSSYWLSGHGEFSSGGPSNRHWQQGVLNSRVNHNQTNLTVTEEWAGGASSTFQLTRTATGWESQRFTLGELEINGGGTCQNNDFFGLFDRCYSLTFKLNYHIHSLLGNIRYHIDISEASDLNTEVRRSTLTLIGRTHSKVHVGVQIESGESQTVVEQTGGTVRFRVVTTKQPTQNLPVKVLVSETENFLSASEKVERTVIVRQNTLYTVFMVQIENDNVDEAPGIVSAAIVSDPNYGINQHLSNSKNINLVDDDVPEITISPHPYTDPSVLELPASYALFEVTAEIPPFERIEVQYVFNGTNQHRDTNVRPPSAIFIEEGETKGTLAIKTAYNPNSNIGGSISVKLVANRSKPDSYSIPNSVEDITSSVTVINNNDSIILSLLTTNYNVAEDVTGGNFVVDLDMSRSAKMRTVFSVTLSGGTATKHLDYEEPILSEHIINTGDSSISITIPILDDDQFEGNETFILKISDLVGANFVNNVSEQLLEVTIIDREKPTLTFAENSISVAEEDIDKNIQLILNLSGTTDNAINISYLMVEGSATQEADFTDISNGIVTIPVDSTSIPINIQIKGDNESEDNETFKIRIAAPPTNTVFALGTLELEATITIYDDEPIIMNVATNNLKVVEDVVNGNFIVDVELTKTAVIANPNTPIPEPVSFLVETSSGTATIDTDFKTPDRQPTQPRFKIPADAKTFSFAIPILNDVKNEGNETFNVRIHDLQQATFADGTTEQTLELTIIDNEKPTLSFMQDTKTVEEEDFNTNVELTLNLSGPIDETVDISYEVIAESAIADTDFVDNGNGVVTITTNTTSVPISIQIKGDDINEGNETFIVRVKTPPENAVFADGVSMLEATIKITDDESPTLSVDNSTLTISELAEMTHIGLTLSGPTNEDVVVTYSTSITGNDTALQADFTAQTASTITIATSPPPATPSTFGLIQIPITNDTDEEENETFTLTLTEISGAVFVDDQSSIVVQVTIIDDEGLPTLSIDSTEIAANEQSGYAEIGLSFTPAITEPVTIFYSTIQGTAVGGVDYTIQTNARLDIPTGNQETIFIPITNDNIYEGEEKFSIEISVDSGAAYSTGIINAPITITIMDSEIEPALTISAFSCEYGEPIPTNFSISESIGNLIFNAKLSHPSQNPVTFNYSATADTATGADFYVSSATQYTIQPESICTEIVTPITHDILFEEDEQFEVTFTTNTGTNIIPPFKVKIEDDDVAIWSIDDLAMNEGDSDTEMRFRVYLSTPVYQTVRAKWTVSSIVGNSATFGEDYAPNHNSYTGYVTVLAGRIEGSIVGLEITGDTIFEPDETFTITLSDPEEGTQIGDGVAIGTIINDDPEPTLSVSTISQVSGN